MSSTGSAALSITKVIRHFASVFVLSLFLANPATAKDLKTVLVSLPSISVPFYMGLSRGAQFEANKLNPQPSVKIVGSDFNVAAQMSQIEDAIALGVDLIIVGPTDPVALLPVLKKAQSSGIPVVAVESSVDGVDAVVVTDNAEAGRIACRFIIDKLGGSGNVVIENGPPIPHSSSASKDAKKLCPVRPNSSFCQTTLAAQVPGTARLRLPLIYLNRFRQLTRSSRSMTSWRSGQEKS